MPGIHAQRWPLALLVLLAVVGAFTVMAWPRKPAFAPGATLRIAILPEQKREFLERQYIPLVRYLEETLGMRSELLIPSSYEALGEAFHRGEVDLAYFGGATFVQAEQRDGAIPLVRRTSDAHCSSVVIARSGLAGKFPEDFRGCSFVFGAESSTSGHLLPRYFFGEQALTPEQFFGSVKYLAHHDAVLAAIQEERADAGVLNALVLQQRIADGIAAPLRFRKVWESQPYCDNVWAVPPRLPPALRARILDAFLALDSANPAQEKLLIALSARGFVPATRADFELIRRVVSHENPSSRLTGR